MNAQGMVEQKGAACDPNPLLARLKGSGAVNSLLVIVLIFIIVVEVSVKVGVLIVKTAFYHFICIIYKWTTGFR